MARQMTALLNVATLLLLCLGASADHPCSAEVASACPDRPADEVGECLKDTEQHDNPTEISSECTDFMTLNSACHGDIEEHCDSGFFTDDTVDCLTKRVPDVEELSEKCQGVLKWAVAKEESAEGEEEEVVTDELGMSEKDHAEKKEWQAKRAAVRGEAIERMKMKEEDRKKEEDRVALEEFKKNDPEGYAAMIQQQEEEARQQAEFKRQERARQAAYERQKRAAAGLSEEEEDSADRKTSKKGGKKQKPTSWASIIVGTIIIGALGLFGYVIFSSNKSGSKSPASGSKKASSGEGSGKKQKGNKR